MEALAARWLPAETERPSSYEPDTLQPKRAARDFCGHAVKRRFAHFVALYPAELVPQEDPHQSDEPEIYDERSARWVSAHASELYALYPDEWIMLEGETVVAHATTPAELEEAAEQRGLRQAYVTLVVAPPLEGKRLIYVVQR